MELTRLCPGGEFGDDVELAKELADELGGIVALTELLHLLENSGERILGLGDGALRVVLTLQFEALMMFEEFFAEELGQAMTRCAGQGSLLTWGVDGRQTTL